VQATLTPTADRSRLTSLALAGNARAADTRGGSLEGQSIIVQFLEGSDAAVPTSAVAIGNVVATRGTSRLQSDELEATFLTGVADKGKVDRVIAKDNVRFTGADGVGASCDLLTAFANDQLADLEGQMVTLSQTRPTTAEFAAVTGTKMRLEGLTGRLTVFGAGVFRQEGPLDETPDAPRGLKAIARWSQGMTYDDTTGQLDASGDTEAQAFSSPLSYDELKSQQIKLTLTRGSAPSQSAGDGLGLLTQPLPPNSPDAAQRKQLLTATAIGTAKTPASVTSRRFAVGTARDNFATTQPEMLMYLQGAVITADNAAGTLTVPGEGKLLVVDRRPEDKNAKPAAPTTDTLASIAGGKSGSRGNSLFDWKGSMSVAKATNTLTMSKTVRLIHTPADAAQAGAELECDTLTAELLSQPGTQASAAAEPSLRKVNADGAVFAKSGKREVVADAVTYDAVLRRMEAWSKGVNMVTATDPSSATPVTAQALFWDLATDRIEIRKPGTIVAPR
jgi:lipopolysaccharide export system protein LptA